MREALGQGIGDTWPKAETKRPLYKADQSSAEMARAAVAGKEVRLGAVRALYSVRERGMQEASHTHCKGEYIKIERSCPCA